MVGGLVMLLFSVVLFFVAVPALFLETGLGVVLLVSSVVLLVAGIRRLFAHARHEPDPTGEEPAGTGQTTGVGRAALRTMRTVNDARAMARGPAAYGKRVARRAAFRTLRKW